MKPFGKAVLVAWVCVAPVAGAQPPERSRGAAAFALRNSAQLPLRFEPNRGQTDGAVQYISRGAGYSVFIAREETVLALGSKPATVRMKLVGADTRARFTAGDTLVGRSHYFVGERGSWIGDVPQYARVEQHDVYDGISVTYHGREGQLERDFVVRPGADPGRIRMKFEGADRLSLDGAGNLLIHVADTRLTEKAPVVSQDGPSGRATVPARYVLRGREVRFKIGPYDRSRALVIDPTLVYSTYLGGDAVEDATGIALDASGNVYLTGNTGSFNFPKVNPAQADKRGNYDVYVSKLNASGTALLYSTYLGGGFDDWGYAIAIDGFGSAYVTGKTFSDDFPRVNEFQSGNTGDTFVTKLSPSGSSIVYSSYLAAQWGNGIAVDGAGNAYVSGLAWGGWPFPVVNAFQSSEAGGLDAYLTKINAAGTGFVFSTFLGGGGWDDGMAVAVDSTGSAYVTGRTVSANFPRVNALQSAYDSGNTCYLSEAGPTLTPCADGFVTKFSPSGAVLYSTYLGGSGEDYGRGIAAADAGNAYVVGSTRSTNFPTTAGALQMNNGGGSCKALGNQNFTSACADAFLTKLNPVGSAYVFSTYLGGAANDAAWAVAVDGSGQPVVGGETFSTGFPVLNPIQASYSGGSEPDAFVAQLTDAGAALSFSTFFGGTGCCGTGTEIVKGVAVDPAGNIYAAGMATGNIVTTPGSFQPNYGNGADAFAVKIVPSQSGVQPSALVSIDDRAVSEATAVSAGFRVTLSAPVGTTVTVDYTTRDGSAVAGFDYLQASGTLTFTPGRTWHSIVVPILSDGAAEGPESFFVRLTRVAGAAGVSRWQAIGTVSDPPAADIIPMYRAYNPNAFYHFFTTSLGEFQNAVAAGYRDESNPPCCTLPFKVPNTAQGGATAIFRMYNPNNGRHYYTANAGERDSLMAVGWAYEKDEGFIHPTSGVSGSTEVFRLYNTISGVHLYTINAAEKDAILAQFPGIWVQHTSVGFAYPP